MKRRVAFPIILVLLAFRNIIRNPRRSILTFLVVGAGVGSSIALSALARGIAVQMAEDAIHNLTGHLQIHAEGFLDDPVIENSMPLPSAELKEILQNDRVRGWVSRVRVPGVIMSERESTGVSIIGIDPAAENGISIAGDDVAIGRNLEGVDDKGVVVGKKLLELLESKPGRRVVLMTRDAENHIADRGFRVVGVFDAELESTERSYVFVGRRTLQDLVKGAESVSEIALLATEREHVDKLKEQLAVVSPGRDVRTWLELEPLIQAMSSIQDGFLYLWFAVVLVCVGFGVVNTIFMSIYERTRELGVMQALGMRPGQITRQVVLESFCLVLVGTAFGIVLGLCGVYAVSGGIDISQFARGAGDAGIGSIVYPALSWWDVFAIAGMMMVIGVVGSLYPAWSAGRQSPSRALAMS